MWGCLGAMFVKPRGFVSARIGRKRSRSLRDDNTKKGCRPWGEHGVYPCMMSTVGLLSIVSIILLLPVARAQAGGSQAGGAQVPPYLYDAVTIRPNKSGGGTSFSTRDDSFLATNMSIKQMLIYAYGVRDGLISGLPGWAESARFDIHAKILEYDPKISLPRQERRAMLGVVLIERFHLKVHTEIKQLPVYELIVGKDGPKFKASAPGGPVDPEHPNAAPNRGGTGTNSDHGNAVLTANAVPMSTLATDLSEQLDRTVIDKTGLKGEYDFQLRWTGENVPQPLPDDAPPLLFTAIQEQLGLRLQPGKGPVETLVVDRVERPTEN
jgi:uncharacterized protein (TIGR03435 family)